MRWIPLIVVVTVAYLVGAKWPGVAGMIGVRAAGG